MDRPIIPPETRTKAIEPVPGGMRQKRAAERLGAGVGAVRNRVRAYREGGMAALRPENRNAGQADRPAMRRDRSAGDAEAPRRRVEELELGNAVMREVAEVAEKRPGRRPTAPVGQGEDASGRPSAPGDRWHACPASRRAATYCRHARLGVDRYAGLRTEVAEAFASSKGRYGYRRVKAMLRTGVSEKALRRIMAEDGLTVHVPERRGYGSCEGEATPAPGDLADRDFTAGMPNGKWPADITRNQGRGREGVPLADGSTATTAGSSHARPVPVPTRTLADRMFVKAAETPPEGAHPLVHSDRGCRCRWPGWLALMDRYGLTRSTGAKGRSPDDAAAEGFFGRMRTESVYPGHWEERTRDEVLVPIDDCIRWHDHGRIERSPGWMSPVQIPSKPGNGCVTISKKTSTAFYLA